ncbi:unnamed protein product [Diamesa serratosioi]
MNRRIFLVFVLFLISDESVFASSPVFKKCSEYKPIILEESKVGTFVMKVSATVETDDVADIEYALVSNDKFNINAKSGKITTNYKFDRDFPKNETEELITVYATNKNDPTLTGKCDVKIVIRDINDNLPTFQQTHFESDLLINSKINDVIFKLDVTDIDEGENSIIEYKLNAPILGIDNTGTIFLKKYVDRQLGDYYPVTLHAYNKNNPTAFAKCFISFKVVKGVNPTTLPPSTPSTVDQTADTTVMLINNVKTLSTISPATNHDTTDENPQRNFPRNYSYRNQEEPMYQECPLTQNRDSEVFDDLTYTKKPRQSSTPNESFYKTPTTFKSNHRVYPQLKPLGSAWTNNEGHTSARASVPCYANVEIHVKK